MRSALMLTECRVIWNEENHLARDFLLAAILSQLFQGRDDDDPQDGFRPRDGGGQREDRSVLDRRCGSRAGQLSSTTLSRITATERKRPTR